MNAVSVMGPNEKFKYERKRFQGGGEYPIAYENDFPSPTNIEDIQ